MILLSLKILKKVSFLAFIAMVFSYTAYAAGPVPRRVAAPARIRSTDAVSLLNLHMANSWRSPNIQIQGAPTTIHDLLVRRVNQTQWNPHVVQLPRNQGPRKVITPLIPSLDLFYQFLTPLIRNQQSFARGPNYDLSPRAWMRAFNLKEIVKFKEFLQRNPNILDDRNFATDDLVKARALTGIFWKIEIDQDGNEVIDKIFSGMLSEGQNRAAPHLLVHTCVHGFTSGNINNNVTYYFVPYGVHVNDDPRSLEYVGRKGFLVTHVTHYRNGQPTILPIDDDFFDQASPDISIEELYRNPDYAQATINPVNAQGNHIIDLMNLAWQQIVHYAAFPGGVLPILRGGDTMLVPPQAREVRLNRNERLFLIGLPTENEMELANPPYNLAISTNADFTTLTVGPLRSSNNNENIKNPPSIISHLQELSSPLASYPGLSGGPILRCRLNPGNPADKRCVLIGTNFGAERVFNPYDRNIVNFSNIINRVP